MTDSGNRPTATWSAGDGDQLLEALRRLIDERHGSDVTVSTPPEPAGWSTEATLLALIDYRLARLEWHQNGRTGPKPKPLVDIVGRLHALGLLGGNGDAEVTA